MIVNLKKEVYALGGNFFQSLPSILITRFFKYKDYHMFIFYLECFNYSTGDGQGKLLLSILPETSYADRDLAWQLVKLRSLIPSRLNSKKCYGALQHVLLACFLFSRLNAPSRPCLRFQVYLAEASRGIVLYWIFSNSMEDL